MLIFWTDADYSEREEAILSALQYMSPVPQHRFVEIGTSLPNIKEGDICLAMGGGAVDIMKEVGIVQKNRTIAWLRGKPVKHPDGGGDFMVTYNPFMVNLEADRKQLIAWDISLSQRLQTTGSLEPEVGLYEYTKTLRHVIQYVKQTYDETKQGVPIAMDTETMGLFPWYPGKKIVSISFTPEEGYSDVVYCLPSEEQGKWLVKEWKRLMKEVKWLLTSPMVILRGANLKFDLIWIIEKWGIECTNFLFDTLIVGSLVDENRSNSLNNHAKIYTDMGGYDDIFNDKFDKGHMEKVPLRDLLPYAGGDSDACMRASIHIKRALLNDGPLTTFYQKILHPGVRAMEKVERRGIRIDLKKYKKLGDDLDVEIEKLRDEGIKMLPPKIRYKYADDLSLSRPVILKDFFFSPMGLNLKPQMFTEKTQQPSTSNKHFMMFEDHDVVGPFVSLLKDLNQATKTKSTYVDGFLDHLRPDGKLHPTFNLFAGSMYEDKDDEAGTNTGRSSAKNPAIQTLPKRTKWAKRLRECYIPGKGNVVFSVDYSQGELKVTACLAPEPTMLGIYEEGGDIHALTAAKLSGLSYLEFMDLKLTDSDMWDLKRFYAKAANFGLIYGMQTEGYQEYCRTEYNLKLSYVEAEAQRNGFFSLYPGLLPWHGKSINMASTNGYIRNPLGRVRHLPLIHSPDWSARSYAQRQSINAPIQSTLSDMTIWAIAILEERYPNSGLQINCMTHDNISGEIPEKNYEHWCQCCAEVMENLPLDIVGWEPQLKFTVDAEVGYSLAELEPVKLAA